MLRQISHFTAVPKYTTLQFRDPYSFDTDPDPAFYAEYRPRSNPDPGL
jgi:hypothetical protein